MKNKKLRIGIVSGYFNPLHRGHIYMFNEAKLYCDLLYVIVNNDKQQKLKGSKQFMDERERAFIVGHLATNNSTVISIDDDKSVCKTIKIIYQMLSKDDSNTYDICFFNGGDQKNIKDIPEAEVCKELGIKMKFGIGGNKIQSSSTLLNEVIKNSMS